MTEDFDLPSGFTPDTNVDTSLELRDLRTSGLSVQGERQAREIKVLEIVFGSAADNFFKDLDGIQQFALDGMSFVVPLTPEFADALDRISEDMLRDGTEVDLRVSGALIGTATLSAGFIIWALRAGSLMASFIASRPSWSDFDPLPVIGSG